MQFTQNLEAFLKQTSNEFDYYRKCVSLKIIESNSYETSSHEIIEIEGDINGFSSDGTITLSDIKWPEDLIQDEQDEKEATKEDEEKLSKLRAGHKVSLDFHIKNIIDICLDNVSIKETIFDIINYKTIQYVIYYLHPQFEAIGTKNRKQLLNIKTTHNDKKQIIKKINELNMNKKLNNETVKNKIEEWLSVSITNLYNRHNKYTVNDINNLLTAYHKLWIQYIEQNIKFEDKQEIENKENEREEEKKQYSSYIEWDNYGENNKNIKNTKAKDIYLSSLWPHIFQGPYYRLLSNYREWRCKACNRNTFNPHKRPNQISTPVRLTTDMKSPTSVQSALCIIPPQHLWPDIQAIRKIHDPAYVRWMPHINIFFPFIDETKFETIADYIFNEIIVKKELKSFSITLDKFNIFDKTRLSLSSRGRGRGIHYVLTSQSQYFQHKLYIIQEEVEVAEEEDEEEEEQRINL